MTYAERILNKVQTALSPVAVDLQDDSARHAGHAGASAGSETHFKLAITSAAFTGKSRVERQRMVYDLLADEMRERVHALSLSLKAPGEA